MSEHKRAFVVHPEFRRSSAAHLAQRSAAARLEEAVGLTAALALSVAEAWVQKINAPRPATLFGEGALAAVAEKVRRRNVGLVIVNTGLSPVQQRNLEKRWECKVIDRTALILEIFGARAQTREGRLQVELAALNYQKSRLVRSWTHLERQRGGFGFLGGPGESQIETDRRLIRERIARIRRELASVTRTRELQRRPRRDVPYPLIALIGYTNAGKSTLFNRLTHAGVPADDRLFATLDPTVRALELPSGFKAMLSDTVGFVSDLPTDLVAAFRATLEEVLQADILLHVRDISHPDTEAQKDDVLNVLANLFGGVPPEERIVEVWNKIDKIPRAEGAAVSLLPPGLRHAEGASAAQAGRVRANTQGATPVSALTGEGVDTLLVRIDAVLDEGRVTRLFTLPAADGRSIAWLHAHGNVLKQNRKGERLRLDVRLSPEDAARFAKQRS